MIAGELLLHVPGCEDGEPPFSQELIGGGKVNRSFLVRTRRGRFVVRLNENTGADPGLDRDREIALHTAAAGAGIAPQVVYAAPDRSCLITDYRRRTAVDAALLHAHARPAFARPAPAHPALADSAAGGALRSAEPPRADMPTSSSAASPTRPGASQFLLANGAEALARTGSEKRAPAIVHSDLHHGNVLTADRVYFIDWEYAQVGDPLLDLACIMTYYPRAMPHGELLLEAAGLTDVGITPAMLAELTNVFTLLTYLWYRARRVARNVPATDLQIESAALRRLLSLAPDAQPRHTSAANLRESS